MTQNENVKNYPIIIMTILMVIIFILSISIMGTFGTIKSKSKKISFSNNEKELFSKNYSSISATFSFEIILFVIYFFLFFIHFFHENKFEKFMLFILIICEFLYLIDCVIIPVFLKEIKFIIKLNNGLPNHKDIGEIGNHYKGLTWACYIFLVIILFIDFLLLNLYHNILCNTQSCLSSFVNCFLDMFCHTFTKKEGVDGLENSNLEQRNKINNLTEEIKNLLSESLDYEIKNKKKEIRLRLRNSNMNINQ